MKLWEQYEQHIYDKLKQQFPECKIKKNVMLMGSLSKTERQIDILANIQGLGKEITIVVDCKYFNDNIDVNVVGAFCCKIRSMTTT